MSFALLRTLLWTDPLIVLATALMGTINLFVAMFDNGGDRQFVMARIWSKMLIRIMGMRMEINPQPDPPGKWAVTLEVVDRLTGRTTLLLGGPDTLPAAQVLNPSGQ